jgi:hypothetical protein
MVLSQPTTFDIVLQGDASDESPVQRRIVAAVTACQKVDRALATSS